MGRTDIDGLKGDESNPFRGSDVRLVPARRRRHDLLPGAAQRARDGGSADQRRQDGRLRPGPGRRVRAGDSAPRDGLSHGRQRADLRRARARLRRRPPLVRLASGTDLPQPLLRADRAARTSTRGGRGSTPTRSPLVGSISETIFEHLTRCRGHAGAASSTATASSGGSSSTRSTPSTSSATTTRSDGLHSAGCVGQPARGVVHRASLRRLPAGQLLRRAAVRHPQQPAVHPRPGRGGRRRSGLGQDAAAHHLRRARRLLRPRAPAVRRAGGARDAADHGRARPGVRGVSVDARPARCSARTICTSITRRS